MRHGPSSHLVGLPSCHCPCSADLVRSPGRTARQRFHGLRCALPQNSATAGCAEAPQKAATAPHPRLRIQSCRRLCRVRRPPAAAPAAADVCSSSDSVSPHGAVALPYERPNRIDVLLFRPGDQRGRVLDRPEDGQGGCTPRQGVPTAGCRRPGPATILHVNCGLGVLDVP